MLQFFCIDMRKADYVFILCTVLPAARALAAVRIKARSVWWGLVSHLYNEKLQTSYFTDGWETRPCSKPALARCCFQKQHARPHGYYGTGCILLTNETCSSLW
jgi:hypothetical protein